MDLKLAGKTAFVLGASKGIGRGIADALAAEGVGVAIVARGREALERAVAENKAKGHRVIGLCADLANWSSIETAVGDARKSLGSIDILVNNSGGPPPSPVLGVTPEVWLAQFNAMVLALFRLTDTLIPDMRARKFGRVLTVASSAVVEPIAAIGVSNTLRSAIVGWSKTLAGEVARDGITVNMLLPGAIATDRIAQINRVVAERSKMAVEEVAKRSEAAIPVGRFGTIEEFGAVAAFLASPLASYVTGSKIRIDGGSIRSV